LNWKSVKNLLILLLLAANLFLLYQVLLQQRQLNYLSEQEADDAIALLAERGLTVDKTVIPLKRFRADVCVGTWKGNYHETAALHLSGCDREVLTILPSGRVRILLKNGAVFESDEQFHFSYSVNTTSLSESDGDSGNGDTFFAYTDITSENFHEKAIQGEELSQSDKRQLSDAMQSLFDFHSDNDSNLTATILDVFLLRNDSSAEPMIYVFAEQYLNGIPIYGNKIICIFQNGKLTSAYGRWYFDKIDSGYSVTLYDQINILFADLRVLKTYQNKEDDEPAKDSILPDVTASAGLFAMANSNFASRNPENLSDTAVDESENAETHVLQSLLSCYIIYWNADKTALQFIPAWQMTHTDGTKVILNAATGTEYR